MQVVQMVRTGLVIAGNDHQSMGVVCRYLDNVFPELFVPGDALASGELRNAKGGR